jgi:hypothetical protein
VTPGQKKLFRQVEREDIRLTKSMLSPIKDPSQNANNKQKFEKSDGFWNVHKLKKQSHPNISDQVAKIRVHFHATKLDENEFHSWSSSDEVALGRVKACIECILMRLLINATFSRICLRRLAGTQKEIEIAACVRLLALFRGFEAHVRQGLRISFAQYNIPNRCSDWI